MSDGDITVIGPECFSSTDDTVISWKGLNYYKACDEPIITNADGSGTHCVKRVDHPGDIHEDYDGARKTEAKGQTVIVVSFPLAEDHVEGHQNSQAVMNKLRSYFQDEGLPKTQVYMAIRESADQIIMVLEGDG